MMPWLGWCLLCNQKTVPTCHLGSQVLVVSNYLSKLNMLEVSAGTVWQLKYTGYIFGHGTMTFGNFIPKSGGERGSEEKPTLVPWACRHHYQHANLVHWGREEVEMVWDTWPCRATAGLCSLTQRGQCRAFLGQCSAAKASQQLPVPVGRWRQPWGSCSSGDSARLAAVSQDVLAPHLSLSPVRHHYWDRWGELLAMAGS